MKKLAYVVTLTALTALSGTVSAAPVAVVPGTAITPEVCALLRDRVNISLSKDVVMAYNCATTAVQINVAACHPSGSQKPMTVTCTQVGTNAEDDSPIWNNSSCPTPGTDPATTMEIQGRRVFTGSSAGGSVAAGSLDASTCNQGALGGQALMQVQ